MLPKKRYKCVLFQAQRGIWKDMHAAPFWRVGDEAGPESTVCFIVFCVFCYFFIFLHEKKTRQVAVSVTFEKGNLAVIGGQGQI